MAIKWLVGEGESILFSDVAPCRLSLPQWMTKHMDTWARMESADDYTYVHMSNSGISGLKD